jgi:hypothetical protein
MKQHQLLALIALGALAACGGHDAPEADADKAIAAATSTAAAPTVKVPHVKAMDVGHALDSTQRISGGVSTSFHQGDTIFVSVRTDFVPEGANIGIRLLQGKSTADSAGVKSPAPNAEGAAVLSATFAAPKKGWALGAYRLEVFLDGVSQGLSDFEVLK